jgi:N-acetylglucosamine-6-phosphate deacetylase
MPLAGLPDGTYPYGNGDRIVKRGAVLTLEANGRIAGSAVTLLECVNNFRRFTGCGVAEALGGVTERPARMLGLGVEGRKGTLRSGADADLCVLDEDAEGELQVCEVWKFGVKVHC